MKTINSTLVALVFATRIQSYMYVYLRSRYMQTHTYTPIRSNNPLYLLKRGKKQHKLHEHEPKQIMFYTYNNDFNSLILIFQINIRYTQLATTVLHPCPTLQITPHFWNHKLFNVNNVNFIICFPFYYAMWRILLQWNLHCASGVFVLVFFFSFALEWGQSTTIDMEHNARDHIVKKSVVPCFILHRNFHLRTRMMRLSIRHTFS